MNATHVGALSRESNICIATSSPIKVKNDFLVQNVGGSFPGGQAVVVSITLEVQGDGKCVC